MENHASQTGIFGSSSNYHKVTVETHPWQNGFVTDVYVQHFQAGKEVSRKHEEFLSKDPIEAYNTHNLLLHAAESLGQGYFTGFDHFKTETVFEPLEINIDTKDQNLPEIKSKVRAEAKESANNLPQNLEQNIIENSLNKSNLEGTENLTPRTTGDDTIFGNAEETVSGFFGNGQRASSVLKGQLEDYVLEGGSPILGALGASGLDVLNLAMGFAEGTALGILDTRNLGKGAKKGTWEGAKEDAARLLNILPQGKAAKLLNTALTVSDLTTAAANQDTKSLAVAGGFALLSATGKKGKKQNQKKKKEQKTYTKGKAKKKESTKQKENYEHGIDPHIITELKKNRERHHAILQALFKRLKDKTLASFIHEGPSHPITVKLHRKIHKELNEMLRKEGFLERYKKPRVSLTKEEFKRALHKIEEFYTEKSKKHSNIKEFGELKDTVKTFRKTLENAGLL